MFSKVESLKKRHKWRVNNIRALSIDGGYKPSVHFAMERNFGPSSGSTNDGVSRSDWSFLAYWVSRYICNTKVIVYAR